MKALHAIGGIVSAFAVTFVAVVGCSSPAQPAQRHAVDLVNTTIVDSTDGPDKPVLNYKDNGGMPANWAELYDKVKGNQDYVDGINKYAAQSGFDWADVKTWAGLGDSVDPRVVESYNLPTGKESPSDAAIRTSLAPKIGDLSKTITFCPRQNSFTNTRGFNNGTMESFPSGDKPQVRVSLARLEKDANGKWQPVCGSGVFIDCHNLHWLEPGTTPSTTPAPTTTPAATQTLTPKRTDVPNPSGVVSRSPSATGEVASPPPPSKSAPAPIVAPTQAVAPTAVRQTTEPIPGNGSGINSRLNNKCVATPANAC